jgi:hypothetical protein
MHKSGCVRVVHAKISQRELTYIEAQPPCRTLFEYIFSVLVHFKFNATQNYLWEWPLLCMVDCSSLQIKAEHKCTHG